MKNLAEFQELVSLENEYSGSLITLIAGNAEEYKVLMLLKAKIKAELIQELDKQINTFKHFSGSL